MNQKQVKQAYGAPVKKDFDWEIETIVEQAWHDLQGRVSRAAIQQVILEIIPRYEKARIATYVSLFIRREAVDTLRAGLAGTTPDNPVQTPIKPSVDALSAGDTDGSLDQNTRFALPTSG